MLPLACLACVAAIHSNMRRKHGVGRALHCYTCMQCLHCYAYAMWQTTWKRPTSLLMNFKPKCQSGVALPEVV
jgi:hypothetical protein